MISAYLNYYVENWGNTHKSALQPFIVGCRDHTNPLFVQSKMFFDLVEFRTGLFLYKARKNLLPENIFIMFSEINQFC